MENTEKKRHISPDIINVKPMLSTTHEDFNQFVFAQKIIRRLKEVVAEEIGPNASSNKISYAHDYLEEIFDSLLKGAISIEEKKLKDAIQNDLDEECKKTF